MDAVKQTETRILTGLLTCFFLSWFSVSVAGAQTPKPPPDDARRIEQLEQVVGELQNEIELLKQHSSLDTFATPNMLAGDLPQGCVEDEPTSQYFLTYDDGWVLRPGDVSRSPFELKFNVHNQFRYTGFSNSVDTFTDSAGNTVPIRPRNDFDINRGRFVFSGYAFDPKFEFYTNIDYNTVAPNPVLLLLSWMSYRFGDALTLRLGLVKVPGTWEWQESSRFTLGAERTLATTFFRPSITAGIWAQGALGDSLFYHAVVGDGFNTFTLQAAELDTNLAYSALVWWEQGESFGTGFSDLECHQSLSIRIGHGFTYAANDADPVGEPGPEQTVIRLSDGTRLVETGALTPGVTVNAFDISLYTVHLGLKKRGFSFATEYFWRRLTNIAGDGPLPTSTINDHGFLAQGGFFVIPQRLEAYAIGSQVSGDFGTGTEYGAGLNRYFGGRRGNRLTFEVTRIEDSPAQQDRTGFVAGGSGTLFRLQWWHFF